MYEKEKTLILSSDFHFRFSAENECPFSFRFRPQMELYFRRHFRLRPKMKNVFRSASSGWSWSCLEMQSLGLGLGLEIKVLVLILVLKKSLDYIAGEYWDNTAVKQSQFQFQASVISPENRLARLQLSQINILFFTFQYLINLQLC